MKDNKEIILLTFGILILIVLLVIFFQLTTPEYLKTYETCKNSCYTRNANYDLDCINRCNKLLVDMKCGTAR